jgi:nucleotide-binding universal stress UspA family protein
MPGILVGVDGSANSQRALEWAAKEAAVRHAPLTVLAVHQAVAGFWGGTLRYAGDEALIDRARDAARTETDKVLAGLGSSRPESVTVNAVEGRPAEELVNASRDADMIVLGSRGGGGFGSLLLGSVSSQVVHHAHAPVVVIPPPDRG